MEVPKMIPENPPPDDEFLIEELLRKYEARLRRALKRRPRTLEEWEETAEEVGNKVKCDIEEQVLREEGTGNCGTEKSCACGKRARYVADYTRRFVTRHGVLFIERAYYYCRSCRKGECPLDARLQIGRGEYSPAVVALSARFAGYLPPRAAARELEAVCGIRLCANTVSGHARLVGRALQEQWQKEEDAFFAHPDKEVAVHPTQLQLTLDGVMLHVEGGWHEAKLGVAYTRRKEGGVESARYSATLDNSLTFGKRFRVLGHLEGADNCAKVGIVADGSAWIWQEVGKYYARRVQILDYFHASQHLWKVGFARFGEGSQEAVQWVHSQQLELLSDNVEAVIANIADWKAESGMASEVQRQVLTYLCTHSRRLRYETFQSAGYHIGSGVVEAGCKGVVQARMKGPGMRWSRAGAEAILQLRCAVCSTKRPDFRKLARYALNA
jgi:hypothetical protein